MHKDSVLTGNTMVAYMNARTIAAVAWGLTSLFASTSNGPCYGQETAKSAKGEKSDWRMFRGPSGQGISTSAKLPIQWSATENVAWKQPLPGAGASSPIVFREHIYLTYYDGFQVPGEAAGSQKELKRHLMCLNRRDGTLAWDRAVQAKLPEEDRIRDHGFAANTPAADPDAVYCFFGKSGVIAFDHQGKQLWQTDVGSNTHGWGTSASPVLYGNLVIINASVESESLMALDRMTGKELWRARGIKEAWNTPILAPDGDGKSELIVATHGSILAFDPETGNPLWNCDTDITWYMVPSIVAQDGIVYCLGGRSGISALAVRTGGRGNVTKTHRLWTSNKGSNVSSPVLYNGHLYWMNDNLGIAYCAKADSGQILYENRMNRAGQVYASALLGDGKVYYITRDGRCFVVAAKPEFEQLAINDLKDGSIFNGSFAVDESRLLIRSDKFLYAIGN